MESVNHIIYEFKKEMDFLRRRNAELSAEIITKDQTIETLRKELENERKKPGRKKQNEQWQKKYEQVKSCVDSGMKHKDIMKKLKISSATLYRYKSLYRAEKAKILDNENTDENTDENKEKAPE